jgi:hypothetical protein
MDNSRPQRIINLLSAILVLVAGFYIIIFLPTGFSGGVRILIGMLLVIYFLLRVKSFVKRYDRADR